MRGDKNMNQGTTADDTSASHHPGTMDEIPYWQRRFGPAFAKPCKKPTTIICAMLHCQLEQACQWTPRRRFKD